jgi:hypothetical protein
LNAALKNLRMIAVVVRDLVDHHIPPRYEADNDKHARDGEKFNVTMHKNLRKLNVRVVKPATHDKPSVARLAGLYNMQKSMGACLSRRRLIIVTRWR